jgi:hypothetical protein
MDGFFARATVGHGKVLTNDRELAARADYKNITTPMAATLPNAVPVLEIYFAAPAKPVDTPGCSCCALLQVIQQ